MGIRDLFVWYQKKIGTYDRQTWETTVEQRILNGFPHVQMKNTKSNTDFIDLDLVRGSSVIKVKPKQGFMTVARLAILRCVFLPIYSKWWIQQTSISIYLIMFCLYLTQLINIAIYYKNSIQQQHHNIDKERTVEENITCMELIVPFLMTWILSLIHSQIAATIPISDTQKNKLTKSRNYRRKMSLNNKPNKRQINSTINLNTDNKEIKTITTTTSNNNNNNNNNNKIQIDDDGFESQSLNGNGSRTSEEETTIVNNYQITTTTIRDKCDDWMKKQQIKTKLESRGSTEPESEAETATIKTKSSKRKYHIPSINIDSTCDTDDEYVYENTTKEANRSNLSVHDWMNATTNSEDLSCSSDLDETSEIHRDDYDISIFNPPSIKASCTIWKRGEAKKVELSTLEISKAIISKVETTSQSMDYFYVGLITSTIHGLIPVVFRLCNQTLESNSTFVDGQYSIIELFYTILERLPNNLVAIIDAAFGITIWERWIILTSCLQRWILASLIFFLLAIAENTFKQRFLYAKLFSHLTSFRRAQQSELPHFRLNKVKNIKTWLSVRSYLKQRGPQRSVDVIVTSAFIITLLLLSFLCVELLKETGALNSQYHVEALIWCIGLGILLLRFMTLGTKINKKYRNLSVLITEQINLHLQIEQKPHKKEELALANNVLKLAIDLIKELQSPFKISGLSANSILYNTTKLIILSALSGILSELLGFKLKLHKIKIK